MRSLPLQYLLAVAGNDTPRWVVVVGLSGGMPLSWLLHASVERLRCNIKRGTAVSIYPSPGQQRAAKKRAKRTGEPCPVPPAVLQFEASIKHLPRWKHFIVKRNAFLNSPDRLQFMIWNDIAGTGYILMMVNASNLSSRALVTMITICSVIYLGISAFFRLRGSQKRQRGHRKRVGFE